MGEFYKLLGLTRTATVFEIKASYRKLAMELHPDRNGSDPIKTARFRTISAAYEILSDEKKRIDYDRTLGSGNGKLDCPSPSIGAANVVLLIYTLSIHVLVVLVGSYEQSILV